jgi:hypothetical protein
MLGEHSSTRGSLGYRLDQLLRYRALPTSRVLNNSTEHAKSWKILNFTLGFNFPTFIPKKPSLQI